MQIPPITRSAWPMARDKQKRAYRPEETEHRGIATYLDENRPRFVIYA